jgi:hypothetical protein
MATTDEANRQAGRQETEHISLASARQRQQVILQAQSASLKSCLFLSIFLALFLDPAEVYVRAYLSSKPNIRLNCRIRGRLQRPDCIILHHSLCPYQGQTPLSFPYHLGYPQCPWSVSDTACVHKRGIGICEHGLFRRTGGRSSEMIVATCSVNSPNVQID